MTAQRERQSDTVPWGNSRVHRDALRIAYAVREPVLLIDKLIRVGAIDPNWRPEEGATR